MDIEAGQPPSHRLRYAVLGALAVLFVLLLGSQVADYFSPQEFDVTPCEALGLMDSHDALTQKNATTLVNAFVLEAVEKLQHAADSTCPNAAYARNGLAHIRTLLKD